MTENIVETQKTKVRTNLTPEQKISKLKTKLAKAQSAIVKKNRKLRTHRLIMLGVQIDKFLYDRENFKIQEDTFTSADFETSMDFWFEKVFEQDIPFWEWKKATPEK